MQITINPINYEKITVQDETNPDYNYIFYQYNGGHKIEPRVSLDNQICYVATAYQSIKIFNKLEDAKTWINQKHIDNTTNIIISLLEGTGVQIQGSISQ